MTPDCKPVEFDGFTIRSRVGIQEPGVLCRVMCAVWVGREFIILAEIHHSCRNSSILHPFSAMSGVQELVACHVGQRVPYGFGSMCLQQAGVHQCVERVHGLAFAYVQCFPQESAGHGYAHAVEQFFLDQEEQNTCLQVLYYNCIDEIK